VVDGTTSGGGWGIQLQRTAVDLGGGSVCQGDCVQQRVLRELPTEVRLGSLGPGG